MDREGREGWDEERRWVKEADERREKTKECGSKERRWMDWNEAKEEWRRRRKGEWMKNEEWKE